MPFTLKGTSRSNLSGFTLIEVMMVVAIAGVIISLAIPQLKPLIDRARTKTAVRQLRADLQKAKLEAVKRNTNCLVELTIASPGDAGSCLTCISTDNDCTDATDEIISRLNFNDFNFVELQNADFSGASKFVFNSRGMPEQTGGGMVAGNAVINCTNDAGYSFTLFLASSGRIRIQ